MLPGFSKPHFMKQWAKNVCENEETFRAGYDQGRLHWSVEEWDEFGEEVVGGDS